MPHSHQSFSFSLYFNLFVYFWRMFNSFIILLWKLLLLLFLSFLLFFVSVLGTSKCNEFRLFLYIFYIYDTKMAWIVNTQILMYTLNLNLPNSGEKRHLLLCKKIPKIKNTQWNCMQFNDRTLNIRSKCRILDTMKFTLSNMPSQLIIV